MNLPTRNWHPISCGLLVLFNIATSLTYAAEKWEVKSPSGHLTLLVEANDELRYSVWRGEEVVLRPSRVDLNVESIGWLSKQEITEVLQESHQEAIEFPVPRKYRTLDTTYEQLTLTMGKRAKLVFRIYDEGVAYRWETSLPGDVQVADELSEFRFPKGTRCWFPEEESLFTHQERVYKDVSLEELTPERFCSTGVLMTLINGFRVFVSESDLQSYPGMFLRGADEGEATLMGRFAGYPIEVEVRSDYDAPVTKHADYLAKTRGSRSFPWRLMIVTNDDRQLLESELVYALAAPNKIGSTDWIEPGKVSWDWWNGIDVRGVDFRVGVNTNTYKHFIDFAAEYGIEYILLDEGWSASTSNILETHPEVDVREIVEYGKKKGVRVLLWVLWSPLETNMEAALDRFQEWGAAGIKVDFMQRDDQVMIDFYWRCAREAAKRKLLVDFHGACKPMGLRRTYPNVMTYEGVNGLEQYKWGIERTTPDQELILPFIRMVAGPMDYTPGAMRNATKKDWRGVVDHPMSLGTRCHQLAMYVVFESSLQMLSDSPTNYRQAGDCMEFLSAVPTVWDETVVLDGKLGEQVMIARRSGKDWFLGAMTNWADRNMECRLDFLPKGTFHADIWRDGVNADRNAEDYAHDSKEVKQGDNLSLSLSPGGGWVAWLRPIGNDE